MLREQDKKVFWAAVQHCLTSFHNIEPGDAKGMVEEFRRRLESQRRSRDRGMVYHEEPFDLACDLAKERLDIQKYRQQYDKILSQVGW